jgi:hypothetical protein
MDCARAEELPAFAWASANASAIEEDLAPPEEALPPKEALAALAVALEKASEIWEPDSVLCEGAGDVDAEAGALQSRVWLFAWEKALKGTCCLKVRWMWQPNWQFGSNDSSYYLEKATPLPELIAWLWASASWKTGCKNWDRISARTPS